MSEVDSQSEDAPDGGSEFAGHLLHQAVQFSNRDLLQDLLSGEEVSVHVSPLHPLNLLLLA